MAKTGKRAYKLVKLRKDGSIGPLFINRKQRLSVGEWLKAEHHPTKGYADRMGWHCTSTPEAPHLSPDGRIWVEVRILDFTEFARPTSQGGLWYIADKMKVVRILDEEEK